MTSYPGGESLHDASDATVEAMLAQAELPSLLPALAYLTGDLTLVASDVRPPRQLASVVLAPQGGMSADQQILARARALAALIRFRDEGCIPAAHEDVSADQRPLLEFMTGGVDDRYLPMLAFELGVPDDIDAPTWRGAELAGDRDFQVVIIGAGMSGLAMAYRLMQAEVDFVVVERNADVGGVWLENQYPGCRLDTSNFCYSYSFMQRDDWPHQYSLGSEIQGYFHGAADKLGLRDRIQFGTAVTAAVFDEASGQWQLTVRTADGREQELRAHAVVSAVGQLNTPSYPQIPGLEDFAGDSFHSARWDASVQLAGRRVGVIGTGASAYQVVPSIADAVGELTLFQRTPPWTVPTPGYHATVPPGLAWLFKNVPHYHRWFRFYQFWTTVEGRRPFAEVTPGWDEPGSVSPQNAELRRTLIGHLMREYDGYPELQARVVPDYPPYGKRMLRDNGAWSRALKQDNVILAADGIERITPTGVLTRDGVHHELDVIVYCTGFRAFDFLSSIEVKGKGGADLHEQWGDEPTAYLGVTVPNFPNLFCLYGPNTNLVVNGSIVMFSECAVHYALESIRLLLETGHRTMELRPDTLEEYQAVIDHANAHMAWGVPGVNNWYKSPSGRVSQNWPLSTLEYWEKTRRPSVEHYEFS
jgi:4-hydroxyacetophenone monooxygenase